MKAVVKHASSFELDLFILGEPLEEQTCAHVRGCARCSSYVARARQGSLGSTPDWVTALGAAAAENDAPMQVRARAPGKVRAARWWVAPLVFLHIAALGAGLLVHQGEREPGGPEGPYVGTKGSPSVGVYVKRDDRVFLWDGSGPLQVGDHIRLGVAGAGYRYVAVLSAAGDGWVVLYRGELTAEGELPVAWSLDGQGDDEQLVVVLSHEAFSDTELAERAQRGAEAAKDTWIRKYVLPKQRRSAP
jgi:hypothetical protein